MTPKHPAIYALTETGADTARRLHAAWPGSGLFLPERLCRPEDAATPFDSVASALAGNFRSFSGHLVFAACGIVVRIIAPLLRGKDLDPAVVVLDQNGRFAISLVSGHLGGANRLAQKAAIVLGGTAVITTATDTAGLPSLDVIAKDLGYQLDNLPALAGVSRRVLEQEKVGVWDPDGWLLERMEKWRGKLHPAFDHSFRRTTGSAPGLGGTGRASGKFRLAGHQAALPGPWPGLQPGNLGSGNFPIVRFGDDKKPPEPKMRGHSRQRRGEKRRSRPAELCPRPCRTNHFLQS